MTPHASLRPVELLPESVLRVAIIAAALGTGVLCLAFGWHTSREDRRAGRVSLALGAVLVGIAGALSLL